MTKKTQRERPAMAALCLAVLLTSSCASIGGQIENCAWLEVEADGVELGDRRDLRGFTTNACGEIGTYTLRRASLATSLSSGTAAVVAPCCWSEQRPPKASVWPSAQTTCPKSTRICTGSMTLDSFDTRIE